MSEDLPLSHLDAAYSISLAAPKVDTATKRGMMTSPALPKTASPNVCITNQYFKRTEWGTQLDLTSATASEERISAFERPAKKAMLTKTYSATTIGTDITTARGTFLHKIP